MNKPSRILISFFALITLNLEAQDSLQQKIALKEITLDAILQKDAANVLIEPHQIDLKKLDEAIDIYKVGSILNVSNQVQIILILMACLDIVLIENTHLKVIHFYKAIH